MHVNAIEVLEQTNKVRKKNHSPDEFEVIL